MKVFLLDLEEVAVIPDHLLLPPLAHQVIDRNHAALQKSLKVANVWPTCVLDLNIVEMLVSSLTATARADPKGLGVLLTKSTSQDFERPSDDVRAPL